MYKHLKDNNISYWAHWFHSTKIGLALMVHAWFPNILTNYASDKLCKKTKDDLLVDQYNRNRSYKDQIKNVEEIK
jgi:hypothetical protein